MRKAWTLSLALLLGLPALVLFSLRIGFATPLLNFTLKKELSKIFNGELRFGSFRTDLLSYVEVRDLVLVTDHAGVKLPVLTASAVTLNYDLWDALRGRLSWQDSVDLASIRGLKFFLIRDRRGHWNIHEILKRPGHKGKVAHASSGELPSLLATRLVLENSTVVFNDERKGFLSTVNNLEGTLDARAFPLVAFSLSGRTEDQKRDNLSFSGEWNADEESIYARGDLAQVPLKTYLNYVLPAGGLQFEDGQASLSVRVRQKDSDSELDFAGRADVHQGSLKIPGISEPLQHFEGAVAFIQNRLLVNGVKADFLGSSWLASGQLDNLRAPTVNLSLQNSAVPLAALSQQIKGLSLLSLSGTAALSVSVTGEVKQAVAVGELDSPALTLAGIDFQNLHAKVELDRAGLKVPALDAQLWGGAVKGSAQLQFPNKKRGLPGSLEAGLTGEHVQLAQWSFRNKNYLPVTGTASLKASVKGAIKTPDVDASLDCPQAYLGNQPLGRLQAQATLRGRQLVIGLKTWDSRLDGNLDIELEHGSHFGESRVGLKNFSLKKLSDAIASSPDSVLTSLALRRLVITRLAHLSGSVDADLAFSGAFRRPDFQAKLLSRDLKLDVGGGFWEEASDAGLPLSLEGDLSMQDGQLYFGSADKPLSLSFGKNKTSKILVSGPLPMKTRIRSRSKGLKISAVADLSALQAFKNFDRASGKAELDLRLGGTLDSLTADGWLQVKGFNAKMEKEFDEIKNGEAQVWIKDKAMVVENLSFDSGGSLAMTGNLDFSSGRLPFGQMDVRTDDEGLHVEDFAGMLDGAVVMNPLSVLFGGRDGISLKGKLKLHDAVFKLASAKASGIPEGPSPTAAGRMPVGLDLAVEIDDNVWLKKLEEDVDVLTDPITLINKLINAVQENYRSPAFEFRFKPTTADFLVQGNSHDLHLTGSLSIDRGDLHFQENDFSINQDNIQAGVVFTGGKRGDVSADAQTNIHYYVDNPLTGKQDPKTVQVTVQVRPLGEAELINAGLENALLNYSLDFFSEPEFGVTREQQRGAVLSLLVLGVPMSDVTSPGYASQGGADSSKASLSQIASNQMNKLISGVARKAIAKYVRGFGSQFVDYFRVSPKLHYQSGSDAGTISTEGGSKGVSQQIQQDTTSVSWLFEVGKSLFRNAFVTGQAVLLGDDAVNAAKAEYIGNEDVDVRNWGLRATAEYRLLPTRSLELSYSYSVDDNLEPVVFPTDDLSQTQRWSFIMRNTLPTDNYTPRVAEERRVAQMEEREKDR